jgi:hypothetical protein
MNCLEMLVLSKQTNQTNTKINLTLHDSTYKIKSLILNTSKANGEDKNHRKTARVREL